jgi:hypothetical protein
LIPYDCQYERRIYLDKELPTRIILYGTATLEMPAAPAELEIRDPGCDIRDNVT